MAVKYRPEGYSSVTPYLIVEDGAGLIDFVKSAFDGQERFRMAGVNGGVGHAEVQIGDSVIMLADSAESENNVKFPAMIHLYVEDCDAAYKSALAAGATSQQEPVTKFYGDRNASVQDPFGNVWFLGTHVEDVPPEEMDKRAAEWAEQQKQG
jgi:PhnB protein